MILCQSHTHLTVFFKNSGMFEISGLATFLSLLSLTLYVEYEHTFLAFP